MPKWSVARSSGTPGRTPKRRPLPSGARIVLVTVVTLTGLTLIVLGGLGVGLLGLLLIHGRMPNVVSKVLLIGSLEAFGAAAVWGGWTVVDVVRGRIDAANRRRRIGLWLLAAAFLIWMLAAAVG
jgi:hypothetical protein